MLIAFIAVFYASLFSGSFFFWQDKFQASLISPKPSVSETKQNTENSVDTVTLFFVGDIMLDRGIEWYSRQHNDWGWPFRKIAPTLTAADLVFGNLESVISDKGIKQGSIYSFRAQPKMLGGLKLAGFDVLSVANNHSLDYGIEALLDSQERLRQAGIIPVGAGKSAAQARAPALFNIKGTTIGILAYTALGSPFWQAGEKTPGVAWIDTSRLEQLKQDIKKTKQQADIIVVSFHFGDEYQIKPSAMQQFLSRIAIDVGADLVIGHHPHVVQPVEQYKHGFIAYSLGNFIFDQGFSKETMEGMVLKVLVQEKKITSVIPLQVAINAFFQPTLMYNQ